MIVCDGVSNSVRTNIAKMPPNRNINRIETKYITPIRL